jgi:hypothetical protein
MKNEADWRSSSAASSVIGNVDWYRLASAKDGSLDAKRRRGARTCLASGRGRSMVINVTEPEGDNN